MPDLSEVHFNTISSRCARRSHCHAAPAGRACRDSVTCRPPLPHNQPSRHMNRAEEMPSIDSPPRRPTLQGKQPGGRVVAVAHSQVANLLLSISLIPSIRLYINTESNALLDK
jgi:hypothetical protein